MLIRPSAFYAKRRPRPLYFVCWQHGENMKTQFHVKKERGALKLVQTFSAWIFQLVFQLVAWFRICPVSRVTVVSPCHGIGPAPWAVLLLRRRRPAMQSKHKRDSKRLDLLAYSFEYQSTTIYLTASDTMSKHETVMMFLTLTGWATRCHQVLLLYSFRSHSGPIQAPWVARVATDAWGGVCAASPKPICFSFQS